MTQGRGSPRGRSADRRVAWAIGGGLAALALVAGVVWAWQSGSLPSADSSPTPTAAQTPAAAPQELAQKELDEHLMECTADVVDGATVPAGCGIRIPWGTEFAAVDSVRFRIERMPVLKLVDAGFVADGGILVATVTGEDHDGAAMTETYRTETWTLRGDASVTDGDVDLDVW